MAPQRLEFPDVHKLDPEQIVIRYVEPIDTLFVHFYGTGQPGVSVQVDDYGYLRVDPDEKKVIGLQIEAFMRAAIVQHPELLPLAQFAGIGPEPLKDCREKGSAEEARIGLLGSVLEQWSEPATV